MKNDRKERKKIDPLRYTTPFHWKTFIKIYTVFEFKIKQRYFKPLWYDNLIA